MIFIIISIVVILAVLLFYMILNNKFSSKAGSMTSTVLGANDLFLNHNQKAAAEEMVEMKSDHKFEEQSNSDPFSDRLNNKDKLN